MTTDVFSSPNLPALQSKNNIPEIEIISGGKGKHLVTYN